MNSNQGEPQGSPNKMEKNMKERNERDLILELTQRIKVLENQSYNHTQRLRVIEQAWPVRLTEIQVTEDRPPLKHEVKENRIWIDCVASADGQCYILPERHWREPEWYDKDYSGTE